MEQNYNNQPNNNQLNNQTYNSQSGYQANNQPGYQTNYQQNVQPNYQQTNNQPVNNQPNSTQPNIAPILQPTKKQKAKGASKHHWKFFFGWFIGFIFTLGLLGGLVWWAVTNITLAKVEDTVGIDLSMLGDDIKAMKIDELVSTVTDLVDNYEEYTLEELSDKYGIINLEDIVTVSGVGENKTYSYKTIDLTPIIKGEIGEAGENAGNVVNKITLSQLETALEFNLPDLILFETVKDSSLSSLGNALSDLKYTYKLQDIANDFNMDLDSSSILKNLKDNTLAQLPSEIDNMTVEELVGTAKVEGNKIIEAIRGIKIGKLPDELPKLTINQILGDSVGSNNILKAIGDSTLESLETNISNLTFAQLFPAPTTGVDNRNVVIKKLAASGIKLTEVDSKIGQIIDELKISEIFNFTIEENPSYVSGTTPTYQQYKADQGVWALIVAERGDVMVKDLSSEVKDVMTTAKLGSLVWHGVVKSTAITSADLENLTITIGSASKKLADCTLIDIVEYAIQNAVVSA